MSRSAPEQSQINITRPKSPQKSWLKSLLAAHPTLFARLLALYKWLRALPRRQRRLLQQAAAGLTGTALLLSLARAPAGATNTINVVNGEVADIKNGKCSLIEAIINARAIGTGNMRDDCAPGNPSGPDTINLPTNGNFVLTAAHNDTYGDNGLPVIKGVVTINGNGSTIHRIESAPLFRILTVDATGSLTLNSTTISGGYFADDERYYGGGGILNKGQLTIQNSTIEDNISYYWDGGSSGGGISNYNILTIEGSTIHNNVAWGWIAGAGGGIYNYHNATLTIRNSKVTGNAAGGKYGSGGGIDNGGNLNITNSSILNNWADGTYIGEGGGLYNWGIATVTKSTLAGNHAIGFTHVGDYEDYSYGGYGGGIFNERNGALTVTNSTISNNEAGVKGGGIYNRNQMTISNSTIVANLKDGLFTSCKFQPAMTEVSRTILSGNTSNEAYLAYASDCTFGIVVDGFNIFGRSGNAGVNFPLGATDFIPTVGLNSIISPLGNNGGPTQTHALPPGSPAIDRAPNNQCNSAPVNGVDQRGSPRNSDGDNNPSSNECDIGAFERQSNNPTPTATKTPMSTPTSTTVPAATATPKPSRTPKPTRTPKASPTAEPTETPTNTPVPQVTNTPGPSPSFTPTSDATHIATAVPTVTPTPPLAAAYSAFVPLALDE